MTGESLAVGQCSVGDPDVRYPLLPPLTSGCPRTSKAEISQPVEVEYDWTRVSGEMSVRGQGSDLDGWAPLLPPLVAPGLGEGGTPLVEIDSGVYVKDESRNPTWSHKDRLNRCTVSARLRRARRRTCAGPQ